MQASSRNAATFARGIGTLIHLQRPADDGPPWLRPHFRTAGVVVMPFRADYHTGGSARGGARVIRGPGSRSRPGNLMEYLHARV